MRHKRANSATCSCQIHGSCRQCDTAAKEHSAGTWKLLIKFVGAQLDLMSSPPSSSAGDTPPHYVLVSQTPLVSTSTAPGPSFKSFSHPVIEYHYADDLPHALLPRSTQEHVLVLDYDSASASQPVAQSLSTDLAVLDVKVTDAPAASSVTDDAPIPRRNGKIYVIETTAVPSDVYVLSFHTIQHLSSRGISRPEEQDFETVHTLISEFKQR